MKKIYTLGVCLLLCLFFNFQTKADTVEIAGADISYYMKNDSICSVTLNIYTKCNAVPLNEIWIKITSPQNGFTSYKKQATLSGGDIMDLWCEPNHQHLNTCTDTNAVLPGFRKYSAVAEFNLAHSPVCEYYFSWDTCCRTKLITTGAAANHFYIDAYMRNCAGKSIGVPAFDLDPFLFAKTDSCNVKKNMYLNYSSIQYVLAVPLSAFKKEVNFKSGYSSQKPFVFTNSSSCGNISIDEHGSVIFNPAQPDVSPVSFKIARTIKDTFVGYASRDVIYVAMQMPENRKPIISGINGGSAISMEFFPGESRCFTIYSFDVDEDSVKLFATQKPGNTTFDVEAGKRFPKGTFCWYPDESYISTKPYELRIVAEDDVADCRDLKLKGRTEKTILIYVCEHNPEHSCHLGVTNEAALNKLWLYPQPAQNAVYVEIPEAKINTLQITDMAGRIFSPNYIWEGNKLKIDLAGLKHGTYLLEIITAKNIYHNKLIISK